MEPCIQSAVEPCIQSAMEFHAQDLFAQPCIQSAMEFHAQDLYVQTQEGQKGGSLTMHQEWSIPSFYMPCFPQLGAHTVHADLLMPIVPHVSTDPVDRNAIAEQLLHAQPEYY